MLLYLKNLLPRIQQFSAQLSKEEIFVDKPWVLIDLNGNNHEYIFLRNHELILSVNGIVTKGSWQLLPTGKLLIDRVTDNILLQQAFIDEGILILKLSGTDDLPFMLLNENVIPDKDPEKYLRKVEANFLNYDLFETSEGIILNNLNSDTGKFNIGSILKYENGELVDGQLKSISKANYFCTVINGVIENFFYLIEYETNYGIKINIEQQRGRYLLSGDRIREYTNLPSNILKHPFKNDNTIEKIEIDGTGYIINIRTSEDVNGEFILYLVAFIIVFALFIIALNKF